jgi:hypothetical protein
VWGGAKSYDAENAWSSINHSILSDSLQRHYFRRILQCRHTVFRERFTRHGQTVLAKGTDSRELIVLGSCLLSFLFITLRLPILNKPMFSFCKYGPIMPSLPLATFNNYTLVKFDLKVIVGCLSIESDPLANRA